MRIVPSKEQSVRRIACPFCEEKIKGIGVLPGGSIDGLAFKCKRCGKFWEVKQNSGEKNTLRCEGVNYSASV